MINKILYSLFSLIILSSNLYSQEFWNLSNGPFGGTSLDLIINQGDEIFAGGTQGVFYSSDDGANWELRGIETLIWGVTSFAIKENYLFAGSNQGLFRSSDKGLSWDMVKSGGGIVKIVVHPLTNDIFIAEYYGVYFSSNNGLTWTDIKNNLPSTQIWGMGIIQTGEIFVGFEFSGLYKSTNYGQEWFRSDTGMTPSGVNSFVQSNDETIYAGGKGIFRSTNKGSYWTNIYYDPFGQLQSLEIYQDSILFAGLPRYLIKLSNNGIHWDTLYKALNNNNFIEAIKLNTFGEIFISVADWGLLKSTDNGFTWERIGLPIAYVDRIALSQNKTLFSIAYMSGLYRSTNKGNNWEWIDHNLEWPLYSDLIVDDSAYVYCLSGEKLYRSFDNGLTWVSNYGYVNRYKFLLNNSNKLFLAHSFGELYCSTDFGSTWILINSNFPGLTDYALDSSGNIYIVNYTNVYKSEDEGVSWNQINLNLPFSETNVIDIDDYDKIYVGTESGLYCSTDYGSTWIECNAGLPSTPIVSIAINKDNVVYAALANEGVYYYDNINNLWKSVDNGPYFKNVSLLLFDNEGFLYGGTEDHSIIKSRESTVYVDEDRNLKFDYLLNQNYPNPFNPSTRIAYVIANRQFVTVKVYDLLGREVATLVNEEKSAGNYEVEFNGSMLPSGIYFYQIKAGNFVETKKMILLK
jgi:photosystem II stability/assembly factor-like uncharacterized protein